MNNNNKRLESCQLRATFGRDIHECVFTVGISSLALYVLVFATAITSLVLVAHDDLSPLKKNQVVAVNIVFALVTTGLSFYQIIITILLLCEVKLRKGNEYVATMWYVSHLSILPIYFILFTIKFAVCLTNNRVLSAFITLSAGIIFEAILIYFSFIVNKYLQTLERARISASNLV